VLRFQITSCAWRLRIPARASVPPRAALSKHTGSNYLPIVPRWVTLNPSGDLSPYPSMRSKPECATPMRPQRRHDGCAQTYADRREYRAKGIDLDKVVGHGSDPGSGEVAGKADVGCEEQDDGEPPSYGIAQEREQHERRKANASAFQPLPSDGVNRTGFTGDPNS
jgi:hypothetical protein